MITVPYVVKRSNLLLRRLLRWLLCCLMWSLFGAGIFWSWPVLAETQHFYLLDQMEVNNGKLATYISAKGAHIVSKNLGYEIVCKAPEWKVVLFDNKDKKLAALPLDAWVRNCTADAIDEWTALDNPKTETVKTALGHRCKVLSANVNKVTPANLHSRRTGSSANKLKAVICLVLDDVPCDPHILRFLNSYMGLPLTKSIILSSHEYFAQGIQLTVETKSITEVKEKEAKIDYPDFSKYKKVTSPLEVMVNNQKKGQYSDLLELGIGSQFGSEKK